MQVWTSVDSRPLPSAPDPAAPSVRTASCSSSKTKCGQVWAPLLTVSTRSRSSFSEDSSSKAGSSICFRWRIYREERGEREGEEGEGQGSRFTVDIGRICRERGEGAGQQHQEDLQQARSQPVPLDAPACPSGCTWSDSCAPQCAPPPVSPPWQASRRSSPSAGGMKGRRQ